MSTHGGCGTPRTLGLINELMYIQIFQAYYEEVMLPHESPSNMWALCFCSFFDIYIVPRAWIGSVQVC